MALIPVFDWEIGIDRLAQQLPHNGALFDFIFFWSHPSRMAWILIILVLLALLIRAWPKLNLAFLLAAVSAGAGDVVSRRVFKVLFQRPRPGSLISGCSSPDCWGFVSSHATNMAAVCTVFCLYDKRNAFWCLPLWLLVSTSRIYLNDHFPLDVVLGGVLGILIGVLVWHVGIAWRDIRRRFGRLRFTFSDR